MNSFNWINYNNNIQLLKKINNHNKKNKFNLIEEGIYNHIRDIFCLTIISINKKNKQKIRVLDYGSNKIVYANLLNKINIKNFEFYIYDPFTKYNYKKNKNFVVFKNEKILKLSWDIINFGSSLQYLKDLNILKKINLKNSKKILITHTPFSMKKNYVSKQLNNKNLYQNIHSYKNLIYLMKKNNFELLFKSRNSDKNIASKKKFKTYSLNLLFSKKI